MRGFGRKNCNVTEDKSRPPICRQEPLKLRIPLVVTLVLLIFVSVPASGQAKQRFPSIVSYKAKLHVAGGLTFLNNFDDLANCSPGQKFTVKMDSDVQVTKRVKVQVLNRKDVSTSSAKKPGGATNNHIIQNYEESNYCPPDDDPVEIDKPECNSLKGNLSASLGRDPRQKGPPRVSVRIARTSGGDQGYDCISLLNNPTPYGSQIEQLTTRYSAIVLPLDLRARSFLTLGVKKKLIRTIHVGGPCARPVVYRGPHISPLGAGISSVLTNEDCEVDGTFNIEFTRLTKKGRPPPVG